MFEFLLILSGLIVIAAMVFAWDGSRDILHPMMFTGPMLLMLYCWIPWKLNLTGGLDSYFDSEQLVHVQTLNVLGIIGFVAGMLGAGLKRFRFRPGIAKPLQPRVAKRLLIGAAILGSIGFACWSVTIINVGGFVAAFSSSYSGGWDDNGYVRDGAELLLVGVMLAVTVLARGGPRMPSLLLAIGFALPWSASALLMGRRGPTFGLVVVVLMGWFIARAQRPPVLIMGTLSICLGWLVLFLVTNRQNIYIGSQAEVNTEVTDIVSKPQTGNEFIYGTGTVLATEKRDHYFWMRRYLAQILVRPVPSAVWPTKYEDFGVPELLHNAGTGEGFGEVLGWNGAPGSAPGIIADLWLEVWWLSPVLMGVLGWVYAATWQRAITRGDAWTTFYIVLATLSIYLVMQTMEAVIFRVLELSIPCLLAWRWAKRPVYGKVPVRRVPRARRVPLARPANALNIPSSTETQHA